MTVTKTLTYAGPAELDDNGATENIVLPYADYVIIDEQPAEPDVGIMLGYVLVEVPGYDSPAYIAGTEIEAMHEDMADDARISEAEDREFEPPDRDEW